MASKNRAETKAAQRAERLAELKAQAKAQERRRNLMVGGVVAVVLVLIGAVFYFVSQNNNVDASDAGTSAYGVTIGPDDAPKKVVIYEDFLCPFCGQLESNTRTKLTELANDGKVQVDYRPFILLSQAGDYSARSTGAFGVVLKESGPEVAKKFHDLLYENQPEETASSFPDADALIKLAVQAGADKAAVSDGIKAGENDFAREATKEAQKAGVNSTPTVLVDGKVFSTNPDGKELLDELE
ncbi:DsbA family protein [Nocardioides plantarum]|uniref:DsbA family protein n=1 Tax=Nocardioides plantarum TaxID=29299 RepID=A0ABV5K9S6_9ACTN|nr:thioredoxin domain-containing protein [Nocardioides plantarum]